MPSNSAPLYPNLEFPAPPSDRPYVFVNMVTTIDGKITLGTRKDPVTDLGSDKDHQTMHEIEAAAQGLIMGAGTMRACPIIRIPKHVKRFIVTKSGDIPSPHCLHDDAPENFFIVGPESLPGSKYQTIRAGKDETDFKEILRQLRQNHGIERLLCEGGSDLNAALFEKDLIDEIFWTIAPKIKLGHETPTMADGNPLPRESVSLFKLVSCIPHADEVFLRYRRNR